MLTLALKQVVTMVIIYISCNFEGATQNGFETIFTVVEPSADGVITIPNETGTMVTTGSSAVVTGTMIRHSSRGKYGR